MDEIEDAQIDDMHADMDDAQIDDMDYNMEDNSIYDDLEATSSTKRTRGPTGMHEITRVSSEGRRRVVQYNDEGQPFGENADKMKSFLGTTVRYHVPINYKNWYMVPSEIKCKIYDMVQVLHYLTMHMTYKHIDQLTYIFVCFK